MAEVVPPMTDEEVKRSCASLAGVVEFSETESVPAPPITSGSSLAEPPSFTKTEFEDDGVGAEAATAGFAATLVDVKEGALESFQAKHKNHAPPGTVGACADCKFPMVVSGNGRQVDPKSKTLRCTTCNTNRVRVHRGWGSFAGTGLQTLELQAALGAAKASGLTAEQLDALIVRKVEQKD